MPRNGLEAHPRRTRSLGLALCLLALLVAACRPGGPPPRPTPTPPVSTLLGVHTRFTDEAEEAKIARSLDLVREMGAGWIVEYFPWAYHEPVRGRYEWEHVDQVVEHALARGIRVIARVDMVPAWARPPGGPPKGLLTERYPDYAAFLGAFAARYRGRLAAILVWNEPNVDFEWGFRPVSVAEYAELLRQAYASVKAADPEVLVLAAGLAPTLEESPRALSDLAFLRQLYAAGAGGSFDGLAAHAYGWREPPDQPPASDRLNFRRVELLRQVMVEHGDAARPIFVTEAGWNDHPRWTRAVGSGTRIRYTLEALDYASAHWPWVEAVCLWTFRLPTLAHNYNDYYTLVSPDFVVKPIYEALRDAAASGRWRRPSLSGQETQQGRFP